MVPPKTVLYLWCASGIYIVDNFLIIAFECVLTKSLKSFGAQDWGPCLDYNAHIYDFEYVLALQQK